MADEIQRLLDSKSPYSFFGDLVNWKNEYLKLVTQIHPDSSTHPKSADAISKLNSYKSILEKPIIFNDGVCEISFDPIRRKAIFKPGTGIEYNLFLEDLKFSEKYVNNSNEHFRKYLPETTKNVGDVKEISFNDFCLPLFYFTTIEEKHCNWIYSRILEFLINCHHLGFGIMNISPENIWIRPHNHGIYVTGFYHSGIIKERARTINNSIIDFYPSHIFTQKIIEESVDLELAKRLVLKLQGDHTGTGVMLRNKINKSLYEYYTSYEKDSRESYNRFRKILDANFKKEFIKFEF